MAISNQDRYYFCAVDEVNGEAEYSSRFLMACSGTEDPDVKLEQIARHFRGNEGIEEGGAFLFRGGELMVNDWNHRAIDGNEYAVMRNYLPTL